MEYFTVIKSRQNTRYKALLKTLSGKLPVGVLVLEGKRLVSDALFSGVRPDLLVFSDDPAGLKMYEELRGVASESLVVTADLFKRLSDTVTPQGVLMLAAKEELAADALQIPPAGATLILDGLSDPGNVGTLTRSAEAFGFDHIIYKSDGASPLSRKAVRASMGSILRQQVYRVHNVAAVIDGWMKENVPVYALDMAGRPLYEMEKTEGTFALIVGNEAHGISDVLRKTKVIPLSIPMAGRVESLNAAVAGAIAMYELGGKRCR